MEIRFHINIYLEKQTIPHLTLVPDAQTIYSLLVYDIDFPKTEYYVVT